MNDQYGYQSFLLYRITPNRNHPKASWLHSLFDPEHFSYNEGQDLLGS